jgi:perosamine synthetase
MSSSRVAVAGPWITEREVAAVAHAAATAWYDDAGTTVTAFEDAFAEHTGRAQAISLPSCTAGLHLSLLALGVGAGDEVIVPESTWIATSAPISYVGAEPVFVDVDPTTWCLDVARVAEAITERTRP